MMTQIPELKETLEEFRELIVAASEEDENYAGQADDVISALDRVQAKLKTVKDQEQFKKLMGEFGWDFFTVFFAVQEILELEDAEFEDFEDEDEEFEDEE